MPADYYDDELEVSRNRGRVESTGGIGLGLDTKPKKKKPKQDPTVTNSLAQKAIERKSLGALGEVPGPLGRPIGGKRDPIPSLKEKDGLLRRGPF